MPDTAERAALRALALLPIAELPAYGDDPETSIRVAIALRSHKGPWDTLGRKDLDRSLLDESKRRGIPK